MKTTIKAASAAAWLVSLVPQICQADSLFAQLMPSFGPGYCYSSGDMFSIYGTVDEYIDHYNAGGKTATRLLSGGAWTSKIGFHGREDLGGGLSAHSIGLFFEPLSSALSDACTTDPGSIRSVITLC